MVITHFVLSQIAESIPTAFILMLAISCVPSCSVLFLIEERASKAIHLQFVSGLQPFLYWLTNICCDMVSLDTSSILTSIILTRQMYNTPHLLEQTRWLYLIVSEGVSCCMMIEDPKRQAVDAGWAEQSVFTTHWKN